MFRNTENNITFHYRANSVKIKDIFLFKFKKHYFWLIPRFLEQKKFFPKTLALPCTTCKGFLHIAKIQKNLKNQFQENTQTDSRTEGWTNPIS